MSKEEIEILEQEYLRELRDRADYLGVESLTETEQILISFC
jgi:indole-3-glycerol phosphate synthase